MSSDWIEGWILLECDSMPLRPFRLFLPPNYPSATPTFDVSREWNTGNIGIVSKCLGLNAGFRKKIIQLFDLGYASRLRLIFCISAGFVLCHIFISYVPTVSSLFWLWPVTAFANWLPCIFFVKLTNSCLKVHVIKFWRIYSWKCNLLNSVWQFHEIFSKTRKLQ